MVIPVRTRLRRGRGIHHLRVPKIEAPQQAWSENPMQRRNALDAGFLPV